MKKTTRLPLTENEKVELVVHSIVLAVVLIGTTIALLQFVGYVVGLILLVVVGFPIFHYATGTFERRLRRQGRI